MGENLFEKTSGKKARVMLACSAAHTLCRKQYSEVISYSCRFLCTLVLPAHVAVHSPVQTTLALVGRGQHLARCHAMSCQRQEPSRPGPRTRAARRGSMDVSLIGDRHRSDFGTLTAHFTGVLADWSARYSSKTSEQPEMLLRSIGLLMDGAGCRGIC